MDTPVGRLGTREHGKDFTESQVIDSKISRSMTFNPAVHRSVAVVMYRFKGESLCHTRYFDSADAAHMFINAHNTWEQVDEKGNVTRPYRSDWSWMTVFHIRVRKA